MGTTSRLGLLDVAGLVIPPPPDEPDALGDERVRRRLPPVDWRDEVARVVEAAEVGRVDVADLALLVGRMTSWLDGYELELDYVQSKLFDATSDLEIMKRTVVALSSRDGGWGDYR